MVGIDQERQFGRSSDAMGLVGELGEGEDDQVGRAEDGLRAERSGKHAHLVAQILGDPCR